MTEREGESLILIEIHVYIYIDDSLVFERGDVVKVKQAYYCLPTIVNLKLKKKYFYDVTHCI